MSSIGSKTSIIAVGSCKGGVGKTTISVNLAMALRRTGSEVGLFDADLYGPNIPLMLGLRNYTSRSPFAFKNKAGSETPFIPLYRKDSQPYIDPIRKFGIYAMSLGLWFSERSVAHDPSFLGSQLVTQVLSDIKWPRLDYLIIDLPPGTGQFMQTTVSQCNIDGVLLVTTPQDMTLLDTGKSLEMFRHLGINVLGRVENMSYLICPECSNKAEVYSTGFDDWHVLDEIELLGKIPLDCRFARPVDADHPFTQVDINTNEAKPFVDLAENIRDQLPI